MSRTVIRTRNQDFGSFFIGVVARFSILRRGRLLRRRRAFPHSGTCERSALWRSNRPRTEHLAAVVIGVIRITAESASRRLGLSCSGAPQAHLSPTLGRRDGRFRRCARLDHAVERHRLRGQQSVANAPLGGCFDTSWLRRAFSREPCSFDGPYNTRLHLTAPRDFFTGGPR